MSPNNSLNVECGNTVTGKPVFQFGNGSDDNVLGAALPPVSLRNSTANLKARDAFNRLHGHEHDQCGHRATVKTYIGKASCRAVRVIHIEKQFSINGARS